MVVVVVGGSDGLRQKVVALGVRNPNPVNRFISLDLPKFAHSTPLSSSSPATNRRPLSSFRFALVSVSLSVAAGGNDPPFFWL